MHFVTPDALQAKTIITWMALKPQRNTRINCIRRFTYFSLHLFDNNIFEFMSHPLPAQGIQRFVGDRGSILSDV